MHTDEFNQVMIQEILEYLVIGNGMEGEFYKIKSAFENFLKGLNLQSNCLHQSKIVNLCKYIDNIYTSKYFNIIDDMDERFFLKERKTLFTPSKFTPFARNSTNIHINKRPNSGTNNNPNTNRNVLEDKTKTTLNSHRV